MTENHENRKPATKNWKDLTPLVNVSFHGGLFLEFKAAFDWPESRSLLAEVHISDKRYASKQKQISTIHEMIT